MEPQNRRDLEEQLARKLGRLQQNQLKRVLDALGDPPRLENLPPGFWDEMGEELRGVVQPVLEETFRSQAEGLMRGGIGLDWNIVNERAAKWARQYSFDLVKGINDNTRRALQEQVAGFYADQRTMSDLETSIARLYGPVRAEMIAITEVTRASSQAEQAYAEELRGLGLETTFVWQTSNDDITCAICGPLHGKVQGDGWTDPPPAHVRCRCWVNTEVVRRGG